MSKSRKGRNIIVLSSIIAVVLVAVGVGAYIIVQRQASKPQVSSERPLDQTPDFGACQITTTNTIKTAVGGDKITALSEGTRVGVDGLTGEKADGCTYPLSTSASSNNLLTVAVYKYASNDDQTKKEQGEGIWTEISGSNPPMYYKEKKIDNDANSLAMLRVITGGNTILFTLRQPTNAMGINQYESQLLLVSIAQKSNLGVVDRKTTEQVQKNMNGDMPPPPPSDTVKETAPFKQDASN